MYWLFLSEPIDQGLIESVKKISSWESSEEIRNHVLGWDKNWFRYGIKNDKFSIKFIVQLEDRCHVPHSVRVIRARPDSAEFLIEPVEVALLHELMSSAY